ncbi:MAG TPA: ATP-dependent Clp protease proteolytic subunit [Pirellulales bacterium]|jgi:ATP-dependent protease ClpP protease subunit
MDQRDDNREGPLEIALVGDLTESEAEMTDKLLSVEPGGQCTLYIDSPGGSPYCAMSLTSLIILRGLDVTGIVTGECSSAALWPFAACKRRLVTPYSVLLFHPMKWQSEEHVGLHEAAEWARHFAQLETDMDLFLCNLFGKAKEEIQQWVTSHRYISGPELANAGLAEMLDFKMLEMFAQQGAAMPRRHILSVAKARGEAPRNLERKKQAARRK